MKEMTLNGNSMWPFILNEDSFFFETSFKTITLGDIVLFMDVDSKEMICHRVIKKQEIYLITKGDFSFLTDEPVLVKSIIGKVVGIKRLEKEIRWGERGHSCKKMIAFFSKLGSKNKIGRYISITVNIIMSIFILRAIPDRILRRQS